MRIWVSVSVYACVHDIHKLFHHVISGELVLDPIIKESSHIGRKPDGTSEPHRHTHTHKPARTTLAHRWRFDVTELYSLLVHFVKLNCAHLHPINQIHQTHSSMKWRRLVHTAAIKYCNEFGPTYDKSIIVRSALMESKIGVKNMWLVF